MTYSYTDLLKARRRLERLYGSHSLIKLNID